MTIQTAPLVRLFVPLGSQLMKHQLLLQLELPEMENYM